MTKIAPFPGLRYNPKKVEIAKVVAPPYDVIDAALQAELYERSPYNIVRLDLAKEEGGQTRYQVAEKNLEAFKQAGILMRDEPPSVYLYFQSFTVPSGQRLTRRGFFAVRRLESFEEGGVKPHENTFPGPKADRLKLMHATRADLSPVFGLFSDPKHEVEPRLAELASVDPELRIVEDGEEHRLWRVREPAAIAKLLEVVHDRPLLIADGHHRYETALNYRDEQRSRLGDRYTGREPFNYVLMYFCSLQDPGLSVLPTHRVLAERPDADPKILYPLIQKYARLKSFAAGKAAEALNFLQDEGEREHVVGWVHDGKIDVLTFNADRLTENEAMSHLHLSLRDLDVTILHELLLAELMGVTKGAQKEIGKIIYVKDAPEAIRLAEEKNTYAFLMNPTKLKQIEAVAEIGEKMPQKSTFFYPKLLTGLVMYEL